MVTERAPFGGRWKRAGDLHSTWRTASWTALTATLIATVQWRHATGPGGDALNYIDAARDLTGPSQFPAGFPLLLSPLTHSWWAMEALTLTIALALVTAIWWAAVKLGGWPSGIIASAIMLLSPGVTSGGSAIMSDRLAALLVIAALIALLHHRPVVAGVLTALSGWVRLVHVAFCAALPRRAWLPAGGVVVGLVVWQLAVKGSLLGYSSGEAAFSPGNITGPVSLEVVGNPAHVSNLVYFPAVLAIGLGYQVMPLLILPGAIGVWRMRHTDAGRFAAVLAAVNLAVYLPYFAQSARFMLPTGCVLIAFAAGVTPPRTPTADAPVRSRHRSLTS